MKRQAFPREVSTTAKYLCTHCRHAFKRQVTLTAERATWRRRNWDLPDATCPTCSGTAFWVDPRFRAPRARDLKTWKVIAWLHENGWQYLLNTSRPPLTRRAAQKIIDRIEANRRA